VKLHSIYTVTKKSYHNFFKKNFNTKYLRTIQAIMFSKTSASRRVANSWFRLNKRSNDNDRSLQYFLLDQYVITRAYKFKKTVIKKLFRKKFENGFVFFKKSMLP